MLPNAIPDVFSEKPVVIKGRYTQAGRGKVVITGILGDQPWRKEVQLNFPEGPMYTNLMDDLREEGAEGNLEANTSPQGAVPANAQNAFGERGSAIATLWAREMIEEVMRSNWLAMYSNLPAEQRTAKDKRTVEAVTGLGLRFGLMTQYTSFVAVEKRVINVGGKQRTVAVPVEMADGVSYEGIFGADKAKDANVAYFAAPSPLSTAAGGGFGGGGVAGRPAGGLYRGGANLPASLPVRRLQVREAVKSLADGELALGLSVWWDEVKKVIHVRKPDGKEEEKSFNLLPPDEILALASTFDDETEKRFLKTLSEEHQERYWYTLKVDKKVKGMKVSTYPIQIWTESWKPEFEEALKKAGLDELQASPGLKTVFGSTDSKGLHKLAALPFVRRVLPIEG